MLSSPVFIVFIPLLVIRAFTENKDRYLCYIVIACNLIYFGILASTQSGSTIFNFSIYDFFSDIYWVFLYYGIRVVSGCMSCVPLNDMAIIEGPFTVLIPAIIFAAITPYLFYVTSQRCGKTYTLLKILYISMASVWLFVKLRLDKNQDDIMSLIQNFEWGARYSVLSCAMLYLLSGIFIDILATKRKTIIGIPLFIIMLYTSFLNYNFSMHFADFGWPHWAKTLEERRHTNQPPPNVPINPEGWFISHVNENLCLDSNNSSKVKITNPSK